MFKAKGAMQTNNRLWHTLLVILPILMSMSAMLFGIGYLLNGIDTSVNKQESDRAWLAVQSAVSSAQAQISVLLHDNANWDDAVLRVYGQFEADWVEDMWGVYSDDPNYDIFMIASAQGDMLASFAYGSKVDLTFRELLGTQAESMLSSLSTNTTNFMTITTLAETQFGLTIIGAGPIVPSSANVEMPAGPPNLMVFAKVITPEILAEIGKVFAIDNLDIRAISPGGSEPFTLKSTWGTPVAFATWDPLMPGDAAKAAYGVTTSALILLLLLTMLPISIGHFITLQRMQAGERSALAESRRDSLSGLQNRLRLVEDINKNLESAQLGQLSILFLDLDEFKVVNDFYDHEVGDRLIVAFARRVQEILEPSESFARLGGDEFAILVPGSNALSRSEELAKAVIELVQEPFDLDAHLVMIGVSVGVSDLDCVAITTPELMRRADIAMFEAKATGGNTWRRFDSKLDTRYTKDLQIAAEMRKILQTSAFEVVYQPILSSHMRSIVGVEALARWPKNSENDVLPDAFIRIAEEHGLINKLGLQILKTACRDIASCYGLTLSVNVSPVQLSKLGLVAEIKQIAAEHGLPLSRLEIEITERSVIRNLRSAKRVIDELQKEGAKVALDDFGTGYASVGYLREFNFDKVKLDKSLTQSFASSRATQYIVEGTILIAKGLSVEVTAEGVETEDQARSMVLAGCAQLQGFHLGEPQTAEKIRESLSFRNDQVLIASKE